MERRLSAVFAIDMVGYSRLMEADEVGTLERQKAHRKEFINPTLDQFHGRIVKEMGDGLLVEFPSVVEAVQCAVTLQRAMPEREADVPKDHRITYRIGINLGDIIVEGDDIHGDGVNVAARLEQLAEPGGICISGAAYDQLRSTVEVGYESLGEVQVKNIERPIRAYRVLTETADAGTLIEKPRRRMGPGMWAAIAAVLLLAIGAGGWWAQQPDFEPADPEKFAFELPEVPSIAVLPFDNLSGDAADDYLGDSLTENIIAELATIPNLLVIARNSVFTFKGNPVRVQEVAETLGVRYVLEGSVQRQGDRMRVVTQLVDALTGSHLWAERYDYTVDRIFDVQDDITEKLAEEMEVKLTIGEQARAWRKAFATPDEYRLFAEGRAAMNQLNPAAHKTAERLFNELYQQNPDNPFVLRLMSWLQSHKYVWRLGPTLEPAEHRKLARQYAEKFQALLGEHQTVDLHNLLAWLDFFDGQFNSATAHVDEAVKLAPLQADAHSIGGFVKVYSGQPAEGVELLRLAMRLEPLHPPWMSVSTAHGLARLGKYDEAEALLLEVLPKTGGGIDTSGSLTTLAAVLVFQGRELEAREYGERMLELRPNFSIDQARQFGDKDRVYMERYFDALRKAGIPEHAPMTETSILVLPFGAQGAGADVYSEGATEDLRYALSRLKNLKVSPRAVTDLYHGASPNLAELKNIHDTRYVVDGSVTLDDDQMTLAVRLRDSSGNDNDPLWIKTYETDLDQFLAVLRTVRRKIVEVIGVVMTKTESKTLSRITTTNIDAYLQLIEAYRIARSGEPTDLKMALELYEKAISLDPEYIDALVGYAWINFRVWRSTFHIVRYAPEAGEIASETIEKILRMDPAEPSALYLQIQVSLESLERDEALILARSNVFHHPNEPLARLAYAQILIANDRTDEARDELEKYETHAGKLLPGEKTTLANLYLSLGDAERALVLLETIPVEQYRLYEHMAAVDAYARTGQIDKARAHAKKATSVWPWINLNWNKPNFQINLNSNVYDNWAIAMRAAAVPDWPFDLDKTLKDHKLVGRKLEELYAGAPFRSVGGREEALGAEFESEIYPDGTLKLRIGYLTGRTIEGSWAVRDDEVCLRLPSHFLGREFCVPVYLDPDSPPGESQRYIQLSPWGPVTFGIEKISADE